MISITSCSTSCTRIYYPVLRVSVFFFFYPSSFCVLVYCSALMDRPSSSSVLSPLAPCLSPGLEEGTFASSFISTFCARVYGPVLRKEHLLPVAPFPIAPGFNAQSYRSIFCLFLLFCFLCRNSLPGLEEGGFTSSFPSTSWASVYCSFLRNVLLPLIAPFSLAPCLIARSSGKLPSFSPFLALGK